MGRKYDCGFEVCGHEKCGQERFFEPWCRESFSAKKKHNMRENII